MVILRPPKLKKAEYDPFVRVPNYDVDPGFVIHPSTSELAERLQVDPTLLNNENYSGIYDENGDYIPQYCDDPDKIPQGTLEANVDKSPDVPGTAGEASGPDKSDSNPSDTGSKGDSD